MLNTGIKFTVGGMYCEESDYALDSDEGWQFFDNRDLHPFNRDFFTVWTDRRNLDDEEYQRLTQIAIGVVDWLRGEHSWSYFDASLFLHRDGAAKCVFRWEIV